MYNHLFMGDSRMKNFIKAFIFITIFIIIVCFLNLVFSPDGSSEGGWYVAGAMRDMYKQEKNTIDVLYIGDSNVYTGVSPLEIYDITGITGFSASTPGQDAIGSYYVAKEFFKTQSPKVIMLDTGEFFTTKDFFTELSTRSEIDYMNFCLNKLDLINEDYMNFSIKEKMTFLFPIIRFHDRYQRLSEFDIRKLVLKSEISYKGYLYDIKTKRYENKGKNIYQKYKEYQKNKKEINITNTGLHIENYVQERIDKLKLLCKQNNCELVLMTMPTTDERAIEKYEIFKEFAKEKELKYINFNFEIDEPINWETDTQDNGDHLNIKGAEKVGKYISKYLGENFEFENKKEKPEYKKWNEVLQAYNERKKEDNV